VHDTFAGLSSLPVAACGLLYAFFLIVPIQMARGNFYAGFRRRFECRKSGESSFSQTSIQTMNQIPALFMPGIGNCLRSRALSGADGSWLCSGFAGNGRAAALGGKLRQPKPHCT